VASRSLDTKAWSGRLTRCSLKSSIRWSAPRTNRATFAGSGRSLGVTSTRTSGIGDPEAKGKLDQITARGALSLRVNDPEAARRYRKRGRAAYLRGGGRRRGVRVDANTHEMVRVPRV